MEAVPETGRGSPTCERDANAAAEEDEAEVWQSFEQSVAYMRNLSALYKDAFLTPTKKTTAVTTVTRINAAKEHAREALELLASNLLNASTAIVATMETQEEQLAAVDAKLDRVKRKLREREDAREQQVVHRFFEHSDDSGGMGPRKVHSPAHDRGSLKLTLAGPASSTSSAPQSSYLYL